MKSYYTQGYAIYDLVLDRVSLLDSLRWSATTPSGTDVKFQIGIWKEPEYHPLGSPATETLVWYGGGGEGYYFTASPSSLRNIPKRKVFLIKVILSTSDVSKTPILHDFTITVGSVSYTASECPRCLGTGKFWDINLNDGTGKLEIVENENKLKQDLEKIVLEVNNRFHNQRGNVFKNFGEINPLYLRKRIVQEIVKNIQRLKVLQERQVKNGISVPERELIKKVDNINVSAGSDPRQFVVKIDVITKNYTRVDFKGIVKL